MTWLYLALTAQLLFAVVFVVDTFLVKTDIRNPWVFASFIGGVSGAAAIMLLFFPGIPETTLLGLNFIGGLSLVFALVAFFALLFKFEATRVVPIVGAFVAVWGLFFDVLFLGQEFSPPQLMAFLLLVVGGFFLALDINNRAFKWKLIFASVGAAFLFGLNFALTKYGFEEQGFWEAFIWIRLGSFVTVIPFVLFAGFRKEFVKTAKRLKKNVGVLFLGNQALGGTAFFLQSLAIDMKNPSLVNALQGTQYVFLFIMVAVFQSRSKKAKSALKESFDIATVVVKGAGILLVAVGVGLLFF